MDFSIDPGSAAIAALALAVSVHSAWATRNHNRLSVKPRLTSFVQQDTTVGSGGIVRSITVLLCNAGLGPAVIKDYQFLLDGKEIKLENSDAMVECLRGEFNLNVSGDFTSITNLAKHHVFRAGEDVKVAAFSLRDPPQSFEEDLKRLQLRITYESMYGEKLTYDSRDHSPD